jgi:PRTRC genetic system ThiF family protein
MPYVDYLKKLGLYLSAGEKALRALGPPQKRYQVLLGQVDRVTVLLVGVGGTGSFAAHILAQLAGWAGDAGLDMRLYFIDPDEVEVKNLVRQNFCQAEVGHPKAFTLAWRYSAAFGLSIVPLKAPFSAKMLDLARPAATTAHTRALTIVVGAVDSYRARSDIARAITARLEQQEQSRQPDGALWWIDAGNERESGQVLIGNSLEPEPLLSPLGYCTHLPLPHIQEPGLVRRPPARLAVNDDPSCADLTLLEEQGAMVNRTAANLIGIYLYRLLQSRDLDSMGAFFNLRSLVVENMPIAGGRLVRPPRPALSPPAAALDGAIGGCPDCGSQLITGEAGWQGVRVVRNFCDTCDWEQYACPDCGVEIRADDDRIRCDACGWDEPLREYGRPDNCPTGCGGQTITGETNWRGVRVIRVFCDTCEREEYACPDCNEEIFWSDDEEQIGCDACGWSEPFGEYIR